MSRPPKRRRSLVENPARDSRGALLGTPARECERETGQLEVRDPGRVRGPPPRRARLRSRDPLWPEVTADRSGKPDRRPAKGGKLLGHSGDAPAPPVIRRETFGLERDARRPTARHDDVQVDRHGQDKTTGVVGVLADQVDPAGRTSDLCDDLLIPEGRPWRPRPAAYSRWRMWWRKASAT